MDIIGKPMLWKSLNYGSIAVHVEKLSPNGTVAIITIDGGPDATPCHKFPEMEDGTYFAMVGMLHKRPAASARKAPAKLSREASPIRELAEAAGIVPQRAKRYRGRAGEIRRQADMGKSSGEVTF